MEPFGLFSLLQSLLQDTRTENASADVVHPPRSAPSILVESANENENKDEADSTSPVADAFLFFMETHDARAKKIKSDKS